MLRVTPHDPIPGPIRSLSCLTPLDAAILRPLCSFLPRQTAYEHPTADHRTKRNRRLPHDAPGIVMLRTLKNVVTNLMRPGYAR